MSAPEIRWRGAAAARRTRDRALSAVIRPSWQRESLRTIIAEGEHTRALRDVASDGNWDEAHRAIAQSLVRERPRFVIGPGLTESIRSRVSSHCPDASQSARAAADRMLAGQYDLLGYTGLRFDRDGAIDWHFDPVHERAAPQRFWTDVPFLDPAIGDHKVIWELNRHQHWLRLGRAWWLTGDDGYRQLVLQQLSGWLRANPPLIGVNWASMLELALRSLSWVWAMHFFAVASDAPRTTTRQEWPWLVDLVVALDRQLDQIERNLSTYFSPNTHLLGEALALYIAGRALPLFRASSRREHTGRAILVEEITRQIAADGGHREQSTHYHRYTLDFYMLALAVARITDDPVQHRFADAVDRMASATRLLADDDGRLPHIGDDDGGKLAPLTDRPLDDVRDSLAIAGVLLDRDDLRIGDTPEEAFWMLGHPIFRDALDRACVSSGDSLAASGALPDSGYYVSRSASHHLVVDAGPHGYSTGGHAHADALSMTLTVDGVPLLIDPGTGCYTSDTSLRDRLRSTWLHNTLTVNGRSQSLSAGPFSWHRTTDSTAHAWRVEPGADYFQASHDGYAPLRHRRHVVALHGDLVVVVDQLSGSGSHEASLHWHIDPRWRVTVSGHRAAFIVPGARQVELSVAPETLEMFSGTAGSGSDPWLGWHAPVYGRVEPSSTLRSVFRGPAPLWTCSVFCLNTNNAVVSVESVPLSSTAALDEALAIRIRRRLSTDLFVSAPPAARPAAAGSHSARPTYLVGAVESDAEVLFCRMTTQLNTLMLVGGTFARTGNTVAFHGAVHNREAGHTSCAG